MIRKRGTGYTVRVWHPGNKKMMWIGTYTTLEDAKHAEARATLTPTRGNITKVKDWANIWLTDYARPAAATQRNYQYGVNQIIAAIGDKHLHEIDRPMARKLWTEQWSRDVMRTARTLFGDAMRDGLIDFNPFADLRLETPRGRKDIDALTIPQIHELADIAAGEYHGAYAHEASAIILTLGYTGMRPGELCSLRSADIDLKHGKALIRYSTGADNQEKAPKNGKPREIVLLPPVVAALDQIRRIGDDARVFLTRRDRPFNKGNLAYFWRPIGAAWRYQGNRPVTLYHLRHACATLLVEAGLTPADVAIQLGHQDGGRLVQVLYGHPQHQNALDRIRMAGSTLPTPSPMREQQDGIERRTA